jgi:hypothetical protein
LARDIRECWADAGTVETCTTVVEPLGGTVANRSVERRIPAGIRFLRKVDLKRASYRADGTHVLEKIVIVGCATADERHGIIIKATELDVLAAVIKAGSVRLCDFKINRLDGTFIGGCDGNKVGLVGRAGKVAVKFMEIVLACRTRRYELVWCLEVGLERCDLVRCAANRALGKFGPTDRCEQILSFLVELSGNWVSQYGKWLSLTSLPLGVVLRMDTGVAYHNWFHIYPA